MPIEKLWLVCDSCGPIERGTLKWDVDEDGFCDIDQKSPLAVIAQTHHDGQLGHNNYRLYKSEKSAKKAIIRNAVGFLAVARECCVQGDIRIGGI